MRKEFWRGKKVLVTGHTGFKGSWLSTWLKSAGADLVGYSLSPKSSHNLFDMGEVADGMVSIIGDIRDLGGLQKVIAEHQPEIIIHMAAQALVRESYADPVFTYTTNINGTMNLLEAARSAKRLRAIVMVTSDKAYRNEEWVWAYRETDRLGGRDPYSCSKACAELVVDSYRDSFFSPEKYSSHGVALASARAGNVIGGGDWAVDRLIPDIMRAFKDGKPVLIRSPHATRPWQFVLEALSGYLLLAEKLYDEGPQFSGGWNFGPDVDDVQPVSWITNYLTEQWGDDASWAADEGEHPHEASLLMLDCTKAKRLLGWAPRLRLPTTLDWIIEWNRSYNAGGNVRHSLETQIYRYEELP